MSDEFRAQLLARKKFYDDWAKKPLHYEVGATIAPSNLWKGTASIGAGPSVVVEIEPGTQLKVQEIRSTTDVDFTLAATTALQIPDTVVRMMGLPYDTITVAPDETIRVQGHQLRNTQEDLPGGVELVRQAVREALLDESPAGQVMYTGVVLSPGEVRGDLDDALEITTVADLRGKIRELGFDKQIRGWETSLVSRLHGHEVLNHHMTITPGALPQGHPLRERLGEPIELQVVGWGVDPDRGVAAWQIALSDPELRPRSGTPHITAALGDPSVKPFLAAQIRDWQLLDEDKRFSVKGVLREIHAVSM